MASLDDSLESFRNWLGVSDGIRNWLLTAA
jgi:hypothetical protein